MSYENLTMEKRDGVGIVTITRPKSLNALNSELLDELFAVFTEIKDDNEVKAVVLTGEGRAFVAGADIAEMVKLSTPDIRKMALRGQEVMNLIEDIDKVVIAAVNGFALGGGNELAMACDFRFASETAKFGQPEVNLGILPFFGGTQRLPRIVGKGMAKYLICSAEMIDAEEALRIGLVERVFGPDELVDAAIDFAKKIMTKSPIGVRMAINAVNKGMDMDRRNGVSYEAEVAVNTFCSEDRISGMEAFLAKEEPKFEEK
jgi:enoyl-CoA hydratase